MALGLVLCLMIVAVRRFGCRALGAVPALGLGDSSGLAYTRALEGPTWEGGRGGGRGG